MKNIYLMRHGETLFNKLHLIQGWCDSPLTKAGQEQAFKAYEYFQREAIHFDDLYCSTSERCSDTLEIASGKKQGYHRLKGLKEWNFGRMEGKPEYLHPNRRKDQVSHEDFYIQYDGEGVLEVRKRIHDTIRAIADQMNEGDTILAVSHAGAIKQFFDSLNLTQYPPLRFSNCCIFHYQVKDNKFDLVEIIDPVNKEILKKNKGDKNDQRIP